MATRELMPGGGQAFPARIVWGALLGATMLYYVVLTLLVSGQAGGAANRSVVETVRTILFLLAAGQSAAAWFIYRRLRAADSLPTQPPRTRDPGRAFALYVTAWACSEGIALYGLLIGLIAHEARGASVFMLWSAALLLLLRPRPEDFGDR